MGVKVDATSRLRSRKKTLNSRSHNAYTLAK
jgi:hypothetical protein